MGRMFDVALLVHIWHHDLATLAEWKMVFSDSELRHGSEQIFNSTQRSQVLQASENSTAKDGVATEWSLAHETLNSRVSLATNA